MIGYVTSFYPEKQYGFIRPIDGSEIVFVHQSAVIDAQPLKLGDQVEFEVHKGTKGKQAAWGSVKKLSSNDDTHTYEEPSAED